MPTVQLGLKIGGALPVVCIGSGNTWRLETEGGDVLQRFALYDVWTHAGYRLQVCEGVNNSYFLACVGWPGGVRREMRTPPSDALRQRYGIHCAEAA